jgi:hypothetical protein
MMWFVACRIRALTAKLSDKLLQKFLFDAYVQPQPINPNYVPALNADSRSHTVYDSG